VNYRQSLSLNFDLKTIYTFNVMDQGEKVAEKVLQGVSGGAIISIQPGDRLQILTRDDEGRYASRYSAPQNL
jgi:hypothetical protein